MSSTRTSSPYFSPKSITAPDFFASSIGITWARVGVFCRISAFTRPRPGGSPPSLSGLSCEKSKRVFSASTSEPFCCTCAPSTSRSALCMRCVTEWLRMVRRRSSTSTRASTLSPDLQRAGLERAVMAEDFGLDLLRVGDRERAAGADELAAVADLAARLRRRTASGRAPRRRNRRPSAPSRCEPSRYSATTTCADSASVS